MKHFFLIKLKGILIAQKNQIQMKILNNFYQNFFFLMKSFSAFGEVQNIKEARYEGKKCNKKLFGFAKIASFSIFDFVFLPSNHDF